MRRRVWCRAAARWALAAGGVLSVAAAGVARAAEAPVVPGYNRLKDEAKVTPAELGQVLLGELNCAQCHAAPNAKRILTKGAPNLSDAGARMTPQYLRQYILNPHGMKPGATIRPRASISRLALPSSTRPTATIRSPRMATSP